MTMIKQDVQNSMRFLNDKIKVVSDKYDQLNADSDSTTLFKAGCCCLLQQKLQQLRYLLTDMSIHFSVSSDERSILPISA